MSKTVGNIMGISSPAMMSNKAGNDWISYLKDYDTKNYDKTLSNLTSWASTASEQLPNMGDYTFNVNASDEARQQAQDATYNAYMDRLTPKFEQQRSDLATTLQNKGLAVGSEAYQRAMNDLQDNQNEATNQAAYQSVLAGQQAYSQDLANQINAGTFGNQAQQNYINQLQSALNGSYGSYDINKDIYSAQLGIDKNNWQNQQAKNDYKAALYSSIANATAKAAGSYFSDKRLKENIKLIKTIGDVNIYEFNYIGENEKHTGVLAQEVRSIYPECIIENYKGTEYMGVDYSKLPEDISKECK